MGDSKEPADQTTYPAPPDGWVCFHCGERFLSPTSAREHFGARPYAQAACQLSAVTLKRELREYRDLEERFGPLDGRNRRLYNLPDSRCMECGGPGARCDTCFNNLVSGP